MKLYLNICIVVVASWLVMGEVRAAEALSIEGITEPLQDVTLSVPVPGIIRSEPFKEGAAVRKGDVVVELDRKLEEFEAARRKAVMEQTKKEFESTKQLRGSTKSVSDEELNKKETEYNVALAEYQAASEELARRQIVAPFDGTIADISLRTGSACAPYQTIARLVDTTKFYFVGHLDGKIAVGLKLDQSVMLEVQGAAKPVMGKISFISPVVDPASGLAKVKAIFENADGAIRPGLSATLKVQ